MGILRIPEWSYVNVPYVLPYFGDIPWNLGLKKGLRSIPSWSQEDPWYIYGSPTTDGWSLEDEKTWNHDTYVPILVKYGRSHLWKIWYLWLNFMENSNIMKKI
jgi:hypothetical protein